MQLDALLIGELFELMKVVGIAWIVAKTTVTSQVNVHVHTYVAYQEFTKGFNLFT